MTHQKYKIFANSKVVYLVSNPAEVNEVITSEKHFIIQPYRKKEWDNLLSIILSESNTSDVVVYHNDVQELFNVFTSTFSLVVAAGGVVINPHQEVLMIFRKGHWDIPKGKLDDGEELEKCALREITEETGVDGLSILHQVTFPGLSHDCTYHVYKEKGKWKLKSTYWYVMETVTTEEPDPQTEEDITEARWVKPLDVRKLEPMYGSVKDVLDTVLGNR